MNFWTGQGELVSVMGAAGVQVAKNRADDISINSAQERGRMLLDSEFSLGPCKARLHSQDTKELLSTVEAVWRNQAVHFKITHFNFKV